MDDDVRGYAPFWTLLVVLGSLVLAVKVEVWLRRGLAAYAPPLPRWLVPLVSVPACLLVFVLVSSLASNLMHRL